MAKGQKRKQEGAAVDDPVPPKKAKISRGSVVAVVPVLGPAVASKKAAAETLPLGRPLQSPRWTNRQRTLVFSSRGISYRARHLMMDLRTLMPHSKKDAKMDHKDKLNETIPEICDLKNCNNCLYFEMRKKKDLYLWVAKMPAGPSAKFLVENIHTLEELKLTGNCLKGSRPLLSFDAAFDTTPELHLLKELFFQTFGTPLAHPKSKPFVDHQLSFFVIDGRVWIRHYQVAWGDKKGGLETVLTEIGPRFVLNPIRFFGGSFGGPTLFENPDYVSPNEHRRMLQLQASSKYKYRKVAEADQALRRADMVLPKDAVEDVFADALLADEQLQQRTRATGAAAARQGSKDASDSEDTDAGNDDDDDDNDDEDDEEEDEE